ncbi:hypothetical protein MWF99_09430 [Fusobacterium necrophorum]|uniref:hypothetical protein n=2 Tax=Fusobacterium necrophorum TaxID=859 RepID=UPI00254FBAFE|nr:hypothetical protein [Fusobacterium necrophorum]MDK4523083.1 hypothetical protein [Fusobacterium necrophorum]
MIQDNILKWYTDTVIRKKYNLQNYPIVEKQIKEKKVKLVFSISNVKIGIEMENLNDLNIIFNHFVCVEGEIPTEVIKNEVVKLNYEYWERAFTKHLEEDYPNILLENMSIEQIETVAWDGKITAFEEMNKDITNGNYTIYDEIETIESNNKEQDTEKSDEEEDDENE